MNDAVHTVRHIVRTIAETAVAHETDFGELDAVVGDGDFGFSLARGFERVIAEFDTYPSTDVSSLLAAVARTISAHVGGTSGPIWGTAFLRAATAARDVTEFGPADTAVMLRAAVQGIQARGSAQLGDKTLLDALVPAIETLERVGAEGASGKDIVRAMASTARQAADATSTMRAMRGRASYSGERSIGSPDAGAVAIAVLTEAVAERWPE